MGYLPCLPLKKKKRVKNANLEYENNVDSQLSRTIKKE